MTRFLVAVAAQSFRLLLKLWRTKEFCCALGLLAALLFAANPAFAADSSIIAPGAHLEKLADGFGFTQGPSTDGDGNVYFTDFQNNRIVKWNAADGTFSDWLKPAGGAIGTSFDNAGNLVIAAAEKGELWSIAPDKKVTVFATNFDGTVFNGPNDLWIRPDGGIYFTDPDFHSTHDKSTRVEGQDVYFVTPDHKTVTRIDTDLIKPLGIIGTPDGKVLYVSDFVGDETYAYDINLDGKLTNKRLFCEVGSEGMALDAEGNVYVTRNVVTVFDKMGKLIERIEVPETPRNLVFGGKDHDLLFITATGSVQGLRMRVKGAR